MQIEEENLVRRTVSEIKLADSYENRRSSELLQDTKNLFRLQMHRDSEQEEAQYREYVLHSSIKDET